MTLSIKVLAVKFISVLANSIRLKFYLEVFRILFTNRFLGLENQSGVNPNGEKQTKTTMNATQSRLRENRTAVHYNPSKILSLPKNIRNI